MCVHFIGFKDDAYTRAKLVFGTPDFIHRYWDGRAKDMVMPDDVVVFASGTDADTPQMYSFDDSGVM